MAGLVLAGDIGGTKTLLGLYEVRRGRLRRVRARRYPSAEFAGLEEIAADFVARGPAVDAACFGVPGPIIGGRAKPSNLTWELSERSLARALGGARVRLLNDLAATAQGVPHLKRSQVAVINRAPAPVKHGNIGVIAAGTGLGEAALVYDGGAYHPVASEGGHASFAPRGAEQIALLSFLERRFGHASWERVLSGPGLVNIYRFLRARTRRREPAWLTKRLAREDPAAVISAVAAARRDPTCGRALAMFCAMYGSEAANLALKVLALGGIYLCGGIAPQILPLLRRGDFMHGFTDKGRLAAMLAKIEVRVSLHPDIALVGAAHSAAAMLG
jgi:glucokinase